MTLELSKPYQDFTSKDYHLAFGIRFERRNLIICDPIYVIKLDLFIITIKLWL